jgi:hypothetical protein
VNIIITYHCICKDDCLFADSLLLFCLSHCPAGSCTPPSVRTWCMTAWLLTACAAAFLPCHVPCSACRLCLCPAALQQAAQKNLEYLHESIIMKVVLLSCPVLPLVPLPRCPAASCTLILVKTCCNTNPLAAAVGAGCLQCCGCPARWTYWTR